MIKFGEGAKSLLASSYIIDNLRLHIDGRVLGSPYLWNYLLSHFVMDFKFSFLTVVLFRVIAVDF